MKRWLPSPVLSLAVLLLWLLLVADASAGQWLLGGLLAVLLPLAGSALSPERAQFRRVWPVLVLARRVAWDIVLSNIEVARRILGPESAIRPGLVWMPIELRNIHGITALASIITLTPGTLSAELSEDRRHLLVHGFNLRDAEATIATIKRRYEALLLEIFQ